jgi:hypothetical protein
MTKAVASAPTISLKVAEGNFHATHRSANELCGGHLKLDLTFDIRPN